MPRPNHPEHKLDLGPLPPANLSQLRSGNSAGAESPEFPGASPRYQLGNAMAAVGSRTSAGSPSKEFGGSRLFPKRSVKSLTAIFRVIIYSQIAAHEKSKLRKA